MNRRAFSNSVALALLIGLASVAAFAQSQPDLSGTPGELDGSVLKTYPRDRILELRIHAARGPKKAMKKAKAWFQTAPKAGQIVYVEVPAGKPIFDENNKAIEFADLPKDKLVTVDYAGKLERPAPQELRDTGMSMVTVFWANKIQVIYKATAPTSDEGERKPD
jgi:hypothetical protein